MFWLGDRPLEGVLLDLDGTLLDSMQVWSQIDEEFLGRRGFSVPADYGEAIVSLGFRATAEYTIQRFGLSETPEQLMEEWSQMAAWKYHHEVALKPGAFSLLSAFHQRNIPMIAATALDPSLALPCLARHGVDGWLRGLVTVDQVGEGKARPAIWLEAARQLGLPAERCLALDDVAEALSGARQAGMLAVGVPDPCSSSRQALEQAACLVAENLDQLAGMLVFPQD